jgi:hypothetical protein
MGDKWQNAGKPEIKLKEQYNSMSVYVNGN